MKRLKKSTSQATCGVEWGCSDYHAWSSKCNTHIKKNEK